MLHWVTLKLEVDALAFHDQHIFEAANDHFKTE